MQYTTKRLNDRENTNALRPRKHTMRFTSRRLDERIETINGWLAEDNSPIRFEIGRRNGYTAVDEYPVDSNGGRIGSGYNRTVGCGTPRECTAYADEAYGNEVSRLRRKNCTCGAKS